MYLEGVAVVVPIKTCTHLTEHFQVRFLFAGHLRMGSSQRNRNSHKADSASAPHHKEIKMASGTVKWFNSEKGFGFIAQDGGGADVFAHYSNIVANGGYRELTEGQKVAFDVVQGQKGPQAENIVPA